VDELAEVLERRRARRSVKAAGPVLLEFLAGGGGIAAVASSSTVIGCSSSGGASFSSSDSGGEETVVTKEAESGVSIRNETLSRISARVDGFLPFVLRAAGGGRFTASETDSVSGRLRFRPACSVDWEFAISWVLSSIGGELGSGS